jgi:signal transduction histidine kinase
MKLAVFLRQNTGAILREWDAFARQLAPAAEGWSNATLRDDARQLLDEIICAVETDTVASHQADLQRAERPADPRTTAAVHGTLRRRIGFSLIQVTAEFRALRATVLRLWLPTMGTFGRDDGDDLIRFNDAIDKAMGESVVMYAEHGARTRDTFLAVLGHDLRSPLATMSLAGAYLTGAAAGNSATQEVGARVKRSAATMAIMVGDLLEFARSQLGGEIPVRCGAADIGEVARWAVDDASAAHPECRFVVKVDCARPRTFDSERIQQVLSNLLNNAAQFNLRDSPVVLTVYGTIDGLIMMVHNFGKPIAPAALPTIFEPLVRFAPDAPAGGAPTTSLGLGLFIARQIVTAHGGTIDVTSDAVNGTVFKVWIPALPVARAAAGGAAAVS